ncbi:MAG: hypothetical protein QM529_00005 [Hydrotalea sp.]|nr:hypothetical protein [Hydrotalea sp.]
MPVNKKNINTLITIKSHALEVLKDDINELKSRIATETTKSYWAFVFTLGAISFLKLESIAKLFLFYLNNITCFSVLYFFCLSSLIYLGGKLFFLSIDNIKNSKIEKGYPNVANISSVTEINHLEYVNLLFTTYISFRDELEKLLSKKSKTANYLFDLIIKFAILQLIITLWSIIHDQ